MPCVQCLAFLPESGVAKEILKPKVFQIINEASEIVDVLSMMPCLYYYKLLHGTGSLVHF